MPIVRFEDAPRTAVKPGVTRHMIHAENLMTAVIDFTNGPWQEPEPLHQHIHEQTTYVVEGHIIFYCEGEPDQTLKAGDMFVVPSNALHTIRLLSPTARLVDSFNPIRQEFL